ncbi:homeobox-domain containing protein [Phaffia rhodozyma]|uniref:Homeobox-domain containing protein n=1 Tax=Phaffia rhodozyma TaxID=264483 RepID=A0A0F7SQ72_PHARH|nr:homeobox-domain containing protein [Phaffia rhodozyma]
MSYPPDIPFPGGTDGGSGDQLITSFRPLSSSAETSLGSSSQPAGTAKAEDASESEQLVLSAPAMLIALSTPSLIPSSSSSTTSVSTVASEDALSDRHVHSQSDTIGLIATQPGSSQPSDPGLPFESSSENTAPLSSDQALGPTRLPAIADGKPMSSTGGSLMTPRSTIMSLSISSPSSSRSNRVGTQPLRLTVSTPHASSLSQSRYESLLSSGTGTEPDPSSSGKRKRRRRTSPAELAVLEGHFLRNPLPSSAEREAIALEVQMTARHVQIWFQNKRQTEKKRAPDHPPSSSQGRNVCPTGALSIHAMSTHAFPKSTFSSEDDDPFSDQAPLSSFPVRANHKETVLPLFPRSTYPNSSSRSIPSKTQSGPIETYRRTPKVDVGKPPSVGSFPRPYSPIKSSPLFQRTFSESTLPSARPPSVPPGTSVEKTPSSRSSPHSNRAPTRSMMDAVVQNKELPFAYISAKSSASPSSSSSSSHIGPNRERGQEIHRSSLPTSSVSLMRPMAVDDDPSLGDGRDLWKNMMSDPPSGDLLEMAEDDFSSGEDTEEDSQTPRASKSRSVSYRRSRPLFTQRPPLSSTTTITTAGSLFSRADRENNPPNIPFRTAGSVSSTSDSTSSSSSRSSSVPATYHSVQLTSQRKPSSSASSSTLFTSTSTHHRARSISSSFSIPKALSYSATAPSYTAVLPEASLPPGVSQTPKMNSTTKFPHRTPIHKSASLDWAASRATSANTNGGIRLGGAGGLTGSPSTGIRTSTPRSSVKRTPLRHSSSTSSILSKRPRGSLNSGGDPTWVTMGTPDRIDPDWEAESRTKRMRRGQISEPSVRMEDVLGGGAGIGTGRPHQSAQSQLAQMRKHEHAFAQGQGQRQVRGAQEGRARGDGGTSGGANGAGVDATDEECARLLLGLLGGQ